MSVLETVSDTVTTEARALTGAGLTPVVELVGRGYVATTAWVVGLAFAPVSLAFPAGAVVLTVYLYGL